MNEVTSERKHHPYSPSTLQSLEVCPCFQSRQLAKPHARTTAGTRGHAVVESGQDDSRLGDDDALAAAECLDFVEQRRKLLVEEAQRAQAEAASKGTTPLPGAFQVTELKEEYLPVDDEQYPDCAATTAGYADHVLVNHSRTYAEVIDWKFGFWPVEQAANNLQGIAYALGVFKRFPTLTHVRLFFKQPHLGLLSDAVFTCDQVPELLLRVKVVVARARESRRLGNFAEASPHVPICQFCNEIGCCDKVMEFACKVGRKFYPAEVPEDISPTGMKDPKQTTMALRLCAILKVWCDAFRRQVTDRILRGEAELPPGQKIQEMVKREIADMNKLRDVALRYLTQQEYESTLETTFGALEDLISEKAPRGQKKNMVGEFQQALLDCGAVKKGEPFSFLRAIATKD